MVPNTRSHLDENAPPVSATEVDSRRGDDDVDEDCEPTPRGSPSLNLVDPMAFMQQQMLDLMKMMAQTQATMAGQQRRASMSPSVPPFSSKEPKANDPDTFNSRKPDELSLISSSGDLWCGLVHDGVRISSLPPNRSITRQIAARTRHF